MRTSSPTKAITFEDAHFPLVEVWFRDGHEDADWGWMLRQFEQLFTRKARYSLLLDAGALTRTPSAQARLNIAELQKVHERNTARCCVGSSIYVSSGLVRGALTAMNWFAPQVVPMLYPSSMVEGLDWCVARLDEASLPVRARSASVRSPCSRTRPSRRARLTELLAFYGNFAPARIHAATRSMSADIMQLLLASQSGGMRWPTKQWH